VDNHSAIMVMRCLIVSTISSHFLNVVQNSEEVTRLERNVTITFISFTDTDGKHNNDISAT
jgi:hypothetical protein